MSDINKLVLESFKDDEKKKISRIFSGSFMGGLVGASPLGAAGSMLAAKKLGFGEPELNSMTDIAPHIAIGAATLGSAGGLAGYAYHKLRQKREKNV